MQIKVGAEQTTNPYHRHSELRSKVPPPAWLMPTPGFITLYRPKYRQRTKYYISI